MDWKILFSLQKDHLNQSIIQEKPVIKLTGNGKMPSTLTWQSKMLFLPILPKWVSSRREWIWGSRLRVSGSNMLTSTHAAENGSFVAKASSTLMSAHRPPIGKGLNMQLVFKSHLHTSWNLMKKNQQVIITYITKGLQLTAGQQGITIKHMFR